MSIEEAMVDLQARLARVARGRAVMVKFEPQDFILAHDYEVRLNTDTSTFDMGDMQLI
ncbi:MAG: hypothetical protein O7B35_01060 [Deltaproteobacteria bacterium]|nr:hypothetical protein [Deltaproteobacteria bacterium]